MFQTRTLISVGLVMVLTYAEMAEGLACDRSIMFNGTPCRNNGKEVSGAEACEAMAPKCCFYSIGKLNCFVNKNYKENQGHEDCIKKDVSLFKQLSIDNDKHDELFAVGHVLSTHQVVSELHCLDLCHRNHLCNAYNYQHGGERSELKVCELLFEVDTIGTKRGFRYRMIDLEQRKVLFTSSGCKRS